VQVGPGDKQRQGAKDTHIFPWLTWLTVRYWLGTQVPSTPAQQRYLRLHILCSFFILFQDKLNDMIDHIILLAQRVEHNLAI
jgi:hypothetical protein